MIKMMEEVLKLHGGRWRGFLMQHYFRETVFLFKRGDLFRGGVNVREGVSYGAYGAGEKPKIYGWDEDLADAAMWEETDSTHHIWKYKKLILDPGTLVFNSGEAHSRKLIPSYRNLQFVCREDESKLFVMADEMTKNLDIFWRYDLLLS